MGAAAVAVQCSCLRQYGKHACCWPALYHSGTIRLTNICLTPWLVCLPALQDKRGQKRGKRGERLHVQLGAPISQLIARVIHTVAHEFVVLLTGLWCYLHIAVHACL